MSKFKFSMAGAVVLIAVAGPAAAYLGQPATDFVWQCEFPGIPGPYFFPYGLADNVSFPVGLVGVSTLEVKNSKNFVSFINVMRNNNLMEGLQVTTILTATGEAIHDRQTIMDGRFVSSHYEGTCKILPWSAYKEP